MAALLGLFSSVPAVTKRRARELLDVIKKAAEAITPIILSVSDPVADTPQPITQQQTAPVEGVKLAPKSGVRDLWSLGMSVYALFIFPSPKSRPWLYPSWICNERCHSRDYFHDQLLTFWQQQQAINVEYLSTRNYDRTSAQHHYKGEFIVRVDVG